MLNFSKISHEADNHAIINHRFIEPRKTFGEIYEGVVIPGPLNSRKSINRETVSSPDHQRPATRICLERRYAGMSGFSPPWAWSPQKDR